MDAIKKKFIQLALDSQVLSFGNFTLKSGRQSPYFFNAGKIYHTTTIKQLGECYAHTLINENIRFDHLFGPAYKGIPIVTATAVALAEVGIDATVTFNRKEVKDHGEGGSLIGSPLPGKTIILDDVISAGTAFQKAKKVIEDNHGTVSGLLIAIDRCERGMSNISTRREIENTGIPVHSIITLFDVIDYLAEQGERHHLDQIKKYLEKYGTEPSA